MLEILWFDADAIAIGSLQIHQMIHLLSINFQASDWIYSLYTHAMANNQCKVVYWSHNHKIPTAPLKWQKSAEKTIEKATLSLTRTLLNWNYFHMHQLLISIS